MAVAKSLDRNCPLWRCLHNFGGFGRICYSMQNRNRKNPDFATAMTKVGKTLDKSTKANIISLEN